jgi:hypothetical protein
VYSSYFDDCRTMDSCQEAGWRAFLESRHVLSGATSSWQGQVHLFGCQPLRDVPAKKRARKLDPLVLCEIP